MDDFRIGEISETDSFDSNESVSKGGLSVESVKGDGDLSISVVLRGDQFNTLTI